jgi:hypothetical protein
VACPFFMPVARLDQNGWIHAPRLPLGDPYRGICQARPAEPFEPPESSLHDLCNCGYARSRCDRFPQDSVRLVYILEKSHAPVEHGTLRYATLQSRFVDAPPTSILGAQAQAFLESHLDRRAGAATG